MVMDDSRNKNGINKDFIQKEETKKELDQRMQFSKFKLKIKDVVNQYETVAKRDGIKFDAELGVGEDLADIS